MIKCPICEQRGGSYYFQDEEQLRNHQKEVHGIKPEEIEKAPANSVASEIEVIRSLEIELRIKYIEYMINGLNKELDELRGFTHRRKPSYDLTNKENFEALVNMSQQVMGEENEPGT